MTITVVVDHEYNAESFWAAFRAGEGCPELAREARRALLGKANRCSVPAEQADALIDWASTLPGWGEGPEHAADPLFLAPDEN